MKSYEEMAESVLERRNRYVADKKRKMRKTVAMLSCFCFIAVLGTGVWYAGILNNGLDIPNEDMDDARYQDTEVGVGEDFLSGAINADTTNNDAEIKNEMSYDTVDTLENYDTVDKLLGDAYALVKVEVLQANIENVRSYIYTSYDMKVLDAVYGTIDADDIINVNMPGGTVQGDRDGNTDRLLSVGDKAYLFLMMESETSFAVVGEYRGAMIIENGNVIFDSNIIGFKDDVTANESEGGSMPEGEFVEAINALININEIIISGDVETAQSAIVTTANVADAPPMVYVNGKLYQQNTGQISYGEMKEEFIYLGKIESNITNNQTSTDGIPKENFQANIPIVGAEVYQYGDDVVIQIDNKYWLYEAVNNENTPGTQEELSEEEKMLLDPSYAANADAMESAAEEAARAYYADTVFEIISLELERQTENEIIFSVSVSKGGVVQEPNRTITLQRDNETWKVINEGY